MEIIIFILLFLVLYVYIVKATLREFSRSSGFFPTLFWGVLFLGTLSFLFGSNSSVSYGSSGNDDECQDGNFFYTWDCDESSSCDSDD